MESSLIFYFYKIVDWFILRFSTSFKFNNLLNLNDYDILKFQETISIIIS